MRRPRKESEEGSGRNVKLVDGFAGTAVLLEEVGKVIKEGGVGVTISSQSGWRMPALTAEEAVNKSGSVNNGKGREHGREEDPCFFLCCIDNPSWCDNRQ